MQHLDVVISVDTAISHLAGALGRPTWIMLSQYALDWRWLLDRDSSPWYSNARLFRQPVRGDWESVTKKIAQYLSWFKI
jgi:ADP-heptose:LPS heptosyltransferase